jgi:hypothetical protein
MSPIGCNSPGTRKSFRPQRSMSDSEICTRDLETCTRDFASIDRNQGHLKFRVAIFGSPRLTKCSLVDRPRGCSRLRASELPRMQ